MSAVAAGPDSVSECRVGPKVVWLSISHPDVALRKSGPWKLTMDLGRNGSGGTEAARGELVDRAQELLRLARRQGYGRDELLTIIEQLP
jgi:hypothetical protein